MKLLENTNDLQSYAEVFKNKQSAHETITENGIRLVLVIYNASRNVDSIQI